MPSDAPISPPPSPLRPQPKNRAIQYIEHLLAAAQTPQDQLPSIRHIASEIKVSAPTVYAALKHLSRQGRLRTQPGVGFFPPLPESPVPFKVALTASGDVSRLRGFWLERMVWGILHASANVCNQLILLPFHNDDQKVYTTKLLENAGRFNGAILLPGIDGFHKISEAYEQKEKAVVCVNPPTRYATANFVSTNYFEIGFKAGRAWKQTGRKRVLFLSTGIKSSVSSGHILSGLVTGLDDSLGNGINLIVRTISDHPKDSNDKKAATIWHEAIFRLIREIDSPDAILCTGDSMALSAYRACVKMHIKVPEQVSIIGASGLNLADSIQPGLTRAQQPFQEIGQHVIRMLLHRLRNKNLPLPGEFLKAPFIGFETTSSEENRWLEDDNQER